MVLVDVTPLGLGGKEAETLLDTVGICVNKNLIPYDLRKPADPSGLRIGTPALTTRGFNEQDMRVVAVLIGRTLKDKTGSAAAVAKTVKELAAAHPLQY